MTTSLKEHFIPSMKLPVDKECDKDGNEIIKENIKVKCEPEENGRDCNSLETQLISDNVDNLIGIVKLECDVEGEGSSVIKIEQVLDRTVNQIEIKTDSDKKIEYLENIIKQQEARIIELENQLLLYQNLCPDIHGPMIFEGSNYKEISLKNRMLESADKSRPMKIPERSTPKKLFPSRPRKSRKTIMRRYWARRHKEMSSLAPVDLSNNLHSADTKILET